MANWKTQTINHEVRINLGLSVMDYCILDYIYHTQSHPDYGGKIDGWCNTPMGKICQFFGISKGGISLICSKMEESGFLEFSTDRSLKRATKKWYSTTYMRDEERQRSYSERSKIVHILNGMRSLSEQKAVHFLNATIIYNSLKDKLNTKININDESLSFDFTKEQVKEMEKALKGALKIENAEKKKREAAEKKSGKWNGSFQIAKNFFDDYRKQWTKKRHGVDGEPIYWNPIECGNLSKLLTALKSKSSDAGHSYETDKDFVEQVFPVFLDYATRIDKYYMDEFTPTRFYSKFNSIYTDIKILFTNGTPSKVNGKNRITDEFKRQINEMLD